MINNDEFAKRLKIILDYYDLSAASFAEKIKVQRSSISHLLSGRNKPSLDFVLKVLKEFKEVELYWFLNGKGSFPKTDVVIKNVDTAPNLFSTTENIKSDIVLKNDLLNKQATPINKSNIERIVIFYTDGRFKEYIN